MNQLSTGRLPYAPKSLPSVTGGGDVNIRKLDPSASPMETSSKLSGAIWRRSSYSGDTGGQCVEVADVTPRAAVRGSKNPHGPVPLFPTRAWSAFTQSVKG
ncbi:DUF397 domain-containing protein [Streptomyces lasalocidi]